MGQSFAWHRAETLSERPPSKSIGPYRESERDEKGRRKNESSRERIGESKLSASRVAGNGPDFADAASASYAQRGDLQRDTGCGRKEKTSEKFKTA